MFLVVLVGALASPVVGLQTNLFPLRELHDGSFRMVPYPFPKCGEALYLGQFPWSAWINKTHAVVITGKILVNCPVHNASYVPLKLPAYVRNGSVIYPNSTVFMHVRVYNVTTLDTLDNRNVTVTVINITLLSPEQEYRAVELETLNSSLVYLPYNSTYELVVLNFTNIRMGVDFPYIWNDYAGGGVNPVHSPLVNPRLFGWPVSMTIRILVNKRSGVGYLLDGGRRVYLGVTPFWYPGVIPGNFVRMVLRNTGELIGDLRENPWVVEQVLEKARLASNVSEEGRLIESLASKLAGEITSTSFKYLGRTVYLVSYPDNLTGLSFPPYINRTLKGEYYLPEFIMPQNDTYLIHASYPVYLGTNLNMSRVLREFARSRNLSIIKKIIKSSIRIAKGYIPDYATAWGTQIAVMDSTLPVMNANGIFDFFVVPLPGEYAREFNASYLMVWVGTTNRFHVRYDPSFFTPATVVYNFSRVGRCEFMLYTALVNRFSRILSAQEVSGFNVSAFEAVYPFVVNELRECGFNVTFSEAQNVSESNSSITSTSSSTSSSVSGSVGSASSSTTRNKRSICGPASLLALTLTSLLTKRRR